jgi:vacuolar-type H+-ATPase subunit E/Vma4
MRRAKWMMEAEAVYLKLRAESEAARTSRKAKGKSKKSKAEGLFAQVHKTIENLLTDPKHPGLRTHEYKSLENPYKKDEKVFEAYVQNRTPAAFRVFWCYGPRKDELTIIAITAHP